MKRRHFLGATTALALQGCVPKHTPPLPPGDLLGAAIEVGHRLRDQSTASLPTETIATPVLIVGGGVSGLSCAWWLKRQGMADFTLIELELQTGGNARSGENKVSRYPWGAHYLPLPGTEAASLRLMLKEFDVIRGDAMIAAPEYDERYLCASPAERLYINGHWQDGLVPQFGVARRDIDQYRRFDAHMQTFKQLRGNDGRRAFTIPSALSSRSPELLALDKLSMRDWLNQHGFTAQPLHWYVNYACRDDYGSDYADVSAWAGIHYFACRSGLAANASEDTVLTWPEGNGWLVRKMAEAVAPHIRTGELAMKIHLDGKHINVDVWRSVTKRMVRYRCEKLVWAGQTVFLPHVWPDMPAQWKAASQSIRHVPWITANLTLSELPDPDVAWDNVLYDSDALGYVVATHQHLSAAPTKETVITWYKPFPGSDPRTARRAMINESRAYWAYSALGDLSRAHPQLRETCTHLDVWRWGHAMAQPRFNWLHSPVRLALQMPQGNAILAHSDLSGFSLFEEAHYWGVRAAEWICKAHYA